MMLQRSLLTVPLFGKSSGSRSILGRYKPRNRSKLLNKSRKVTYRSMWERKVMLYCDRSPSVQSWGSENIAIPYYDSENEKWRTYYPDFVINYYDDHGRLNCKIVEVKPYQQINWQINKDKWDAARKYCHVHGYSFQVLTEKEIKP